MRSLEEIALARLEAVVSGIREDLPRLRNAVLESSTSDIAEIADRLAEVLEAASTAAYKIQRLTIEFGGRRDH